MNCGVGHRCGSDPMLLWLWRRPVATSLILHLAWEPPYTVGVALKDLYIYTYIHDTNELIYEAETDPQT